MKGKTDGKTGNGVEPKTLGEYIAEKRDARGLSLKDLGGLVGVSSQYLHDIEKGRRGPSQGVLVKIAVALSVPAASMQAVAGRATEGITDYLRRHPECAVALDALIARAEAFGIDADGWDAITYR